MPAGEEEVPPAPSEAGLHKAVAEGAVDDVRKMLDAGLSEQHKKFNTLYHEIGGPVNFADPASSFPPLMVAAISTRLQAYTRDLLFLCGSPTRPPTFESRLDRWTCCHV